MFIKLQDIFVYFKTFLHSPKLLNKTKKYLKKKLIFIKDYFFFNGKTMFTFGTKLKWETVNVPGKPKDIVYRYSGFIHCGVVLLHCVCVAERM